MRQSGAIVDSERAHYLQWRLLQTLSKEGAASARIARKIQPHRRAKATSPRNSRLDFPKRFSSNSGHLGSGLQLMNNRVASAGCSMAPQSSNGIKQFTSSRLHI